MSDEKRIQENIKGMLYTTNLRSMKIEYGHTDKKDVDYNALEIDVYEGGKIDAGWSLDQKIANIKNCIDLALATNDKEWFKKLQRRYRPLLKKAERENETI